MAVDKTLLELGIYAAKRTAPAQYSAELVGKSFSEELNKLAGNYDLYRRNKLDIYELMQEIFNEVLPMNVRSRFGFLAETITVPHGVKSTFKKKVGRARAKTFVTKVGIGGVFETFRLDANEFEVPVTAMGGAARIDFERLLSGQEDLADVMDVIMEGMSDTIYTMLAEALNASISAVGRPSSTFKIDTNFSASEFNKLITGVKSYGDPIIVCTPEFADAIPGNYVSVTSGDVTTTKISNTDAEDMRTYGALQMYKSCPIVQIPNTYLDETNSTKTFDPKYCYIIPGIGTKIARIVLEGGTIVDEFKNKDRSIEVSAYQKVGVAIMHTNNWAIYKVTSIS